MDHLNPREKDENLPLEMFLNTLTLIQSQADDGTSQLVMWNSLVRQFKNSNTCQAIFICAGTKFPSESFHEFMSVINIPNVSSFMILSFKKRIEENLFVREIESLEKIYSYLQSLEDLIPPTRPSTPITIVVADLGLLLGFECNYDFAEAHAIATKIFLKLRKFAKLYAFSVILFENNPTPSKSFESFFKDQFYDFKVVITVEDNNITFTVTDFGYNFLGYADLLIPTSLMEGMPIQINSIFKV